MAATVTTPEHVHLLRHVIASGDLSELKAQLHACNISPNSILFTEECSATLLHWACLSNRVPIARYLIDNGADLNVGESRANETPLQWAVRDDSFKELVQLLIDSGSDLKHKSVGGLDALRIACRLNNINIAYLLLSSGADPNSLDDRGETVLHEILKAPYNEYMTDLMRLLITLGADCSIPDITGNNSLHLICYYKTSNNRSKFVLAMLNAKPDGYKMLFQKNDMNLTPFGVSWSS
jgi:ankyrin repeat protein